MTTLDHPNQKITTIRQPEPKQVSRDLDRETTSGKPRTSEHDTIAVAGASPRTERKCTLVMYELVEGCVDPDHDLIKRAGELIKATEHLTRLAVRNGWDWLGILMHAVDRIYDGLPQTWAAWKTVEDHSARREAAETVEFEPEDLARRDRWMQTCFGQYEVVSFIVQLEDEWPIPALDVAPICRSPKEAERCAHCDVA